VTADESLKVWVEFQDVEQRWWVRRPHQLPNPLTANIPDTISDYQPVANAIRFGADGEPLDVLFGSDD
jgi:hypothetical protein